MCQCDAIVIPGNGIREGGVLPSWVKRHLDRAIELYSGELMMTLSGGTTHRPPPRDANGFPIFEAIVAAQYLIGRGIPAERILTETSSYDTIGNAFFSRVIHAEPRKLHRLLVIASDFHLARVRAAFQWVYGLEPRSVPWELSFEEVSDPDMDPVVLKARKEREKERLEDLAGLTGRIRTMPDLHRWLFSEHTAYDATRSGFGAGDVRGAALESY